MRVLGINCGHDSSLAIAEDGKIVFALEEERLTGIKKILGFPARSLFYACKMLNCSNLDFDKVIFGQEYNCINRPSSLIQHKQNDYFPDAEYIDHHYAHAISAYSWSGWDECMVMTLDGGGDWKFASIYKAKGGKLTLVDTINNPGCYPFGLFYNNITSALGFTANRHEGKIMGLAAHASPNPDLFDGLFWVDGTQIMSSGKINLWWHDEIVMKRLQTWPDPLTREEVASSCQKTFEDIILEWVRNNAAGQKLAVAGGCFANVLANMKIAKEVEALWVCPPMFDCGLAVGAALSAWDSLPSYRPRDMYFGLSQTPHKTRMIEAKQAAKAISEGKIVGLYQGMMEFGPRALGNRTIFADPRNPTINKELNARLSRTEFMPFAPVILAEYADELLKDYQSGIDNAPFMTCCWYVRDEWRDKIPGVVHLDGTVRPQVIEREVNPYYYDVVDEFRKLTGIPCLINTSFNAHEDPIVAFQQEADWAHRLGRIDLLVEN